MPGQKEEDKDKSKVKWGSRRVTESQEAGNCRVVQRVKPPFEETEREG